MASATRPDRSLGLGPLRPPAEPLSSYQPAQPYRALGQEGASAGSSDAAVNLHAPASSGLSLADDVFHALPEVGGSFLGFHLVAELGRGSFGRVYLARQADLADRLVALKVSTESLAESQKLARLQHTSIMPVYSVHRAGPLQAVCMPYFGATTLADLLQDLGRRESLPASGKGLISTLEDRKSRTRANLSHHQAPPAQQAQLPAAESLGNPPGPAALREFEAKTYVETVLWLGTCLADGLVHAHERGIVHRDLKPANVLLTDDGVPMLLDFNLAEETSRLHRAGRVGGTLPYMAPEHLAAFLGDQAPCGPRGRKPIVDGKSDVYSLGVILFELLTRCPPFLRRTGAVEATAPLMLRDRLQGAPSARAHNPAISPAVEAILRRCLAPDPAHRYASAVELREDLQRQLENQPLRHAPDRSPAERLQKWARRHPRLASTASVAVFSVLMVVGLVLLLGVYLQRIARLEAQSAHHEFQSELRSARLLLAARPEDEEQRDEGRTLALRALDRFGVRDSSDWREGPASRLPREARDELAEEVGELLVLLAGVSDHEEGLRLNGQAVACFHEEKTPRAVWEQRATLLDRLGKDAATARKKADQTKPRSSQDRYLLACELVRAGKYGEAAVLLRQVVADDPEHFAAWFQLGNCCLEGPGDRVERETEAIAHYTACIALRPRFHGAWFNRGLAHLRARLFSRAEADFTRALELRSSLTQALVMRAAAREGLGHWSDAIADLDEALDRDASPTRNLLVRARLKLASGDAKGARQDREEALKRVPSDDESWVARGVARVKDDPEGALKDFAHAVKLNPSSLAGLNNQAHVLAERLDKTREAIGVLDRILKVWPENAPARASRAVLLARLGQRDAAHRDAFAVLKTAGNAPDLQFQVAGAFALTSKTHENDADLALPLLARAIKGGFGHELLETDKDLAPLRNEPRFRALVRAVRTVRLEADRKGA